jgi:hypothetical protein
MNILITTQYMENYGNEETPHWKFKGGSDYILHDRSPARDESYAELVRRLREVIEYSNGYAEEFIATISLVSNMELSERDEPSTLYEINDLGREMGFECTKHHYRNAWNEDGGVVRGDLISIERWDMLPNGERRNYKVRSFEQDAA